MKRTFWFVAALYLFVSSISFGQITSLGSKEAPFSFLRGEVAKLNNKKPPFKLEYLGVNVELTKVYYEGSIVPGEFVKPTTGEVQELYIEDLDGYDRKVTLLSKDFGSGYIATMEYGPIMILFNTFEDRKIKCTLAMTSTQFRKLISHWERHATVQKLSDPAKLADIAKKDIVFYVRLEAVKKLTDQTILADIAKNDTNEEVRLSALKKLTDQATLVEIAKTDTVFSVRLEAVKKLTDQTILANIAKNDTNERVRLAALEKLADQTTLVEIAKTDTVFSVRLEAVKKLTDQTILVDIAKKDTNGEVRLAAVEKLNDQAALAEIAKNDIKVEVRLVAVEKLTEQIILAEIARNDTKWQARKAAVDKLIDPSILSDIANSDSESFVRNSAKSRLNILKMAETGWKISLLSAKIAPDKNLVSLFSNLPMSASSLEKKHTATIVTIKSTKLSTKAQEINFFETKMIVTSATNEETHNPYSVVTRILKTGEKEHDLYFKQLETYFKLEFPNFQIMEINGVEYDSRLK